MNLLITCPRHMEPEAAGEAADIFGRLGDGSMECWRTGISGILAGRTGLEPAGSCVRIRQMVVSEPWLVRYMRRIIPIEVVVRTEMDEILRVVPAMAGRMQPAETYRISVEKRNSAISSRRIIEEAADLIPNPVSLESPGVTLQIQILGAVTGVSALRAGEIFSLEKAKRSISED